MHGGFTKLFNTIVTSTIWQEEDETRIVWITMLALADAQGQVCAALPGLASVANVPLDKAQTAIATLEGPDKWSRTKDFEGRRIKAMEGGWQILNYQKYRELRQQEERREYMRNYMRRRRQPMLTPSVSKSKQCKPMLAKAEAEAIAEASAASAIKRRDSVPNTTPSLDVDQARRIAQEEVKKLKAKWSDGQKVSPTPGVTSDNTET